MILGLMIKLFSVSMTLQIEKGLKCVKIILALLMIQCFFGCQDDSFTIAEINEKVKWEYKSEITSFSYCLLQMQDHPESMDALVFARKRFQRIGWLMEYLDKDLYNLFNGPPVLKEDHSTPGHKVIEPHGLQIIAQLIENPTDNNIVLIQSEISQLQFQLENYEDLINKLTITNQDVISAMAILLIRMETLSIAGFDAPTKASNKFEFIEQAKQLHIYLPQIFKKDLTEELSEVTENFNDKYILTRFIQAKRKKLNPYLAASNYLSPLNLQAASIYADDFLNASFYSSNGYLDNDIKSKIALGRMLFTDSLLSHHQNMSCATCHQEENAFADGLKLSKSIGEQSTIRRNTPSLLHSGEQSKLMYDGRADHLEDQILHVFNNREEFRLSTTEIVERLYRNSIYVEKFKVSYTELGDHIISLYSLTDALAHYVRSLGTKNSTFDQLMRGEVEQISPAVLSGFNLFMGKAECGTCHFPPNFSGLLPPYYTETEFENIGVPTIQLDGTWSIDKDLGRYNFYTNEAFKNFFKTPTLRNIEETGPYMHNGVFATLEEVMDFYNNGGGMGHGLKYSNQTLPSDSLGLSNAEIQDIITFMKTLSDKGY